MKFKFETIEGVFIIKDSTGQIFCVLSAQDVDAQVVDRLARGLTALDAQERHEEAEMDAEEALDRISEFRDYSQQMEELDFAQGLGNV